MWRSGDSTSECQRAYTRCAMSQPLRLLSDEEFSALTTDEKFNYLNEVVNRLLGDRARAQAAPSRDAPPAELRDAQGAPEQL